MNNIRLIRGMMSNNVYVNKRGESNKQFGEYLLKTDCAIESTIRNMLFLSNMKLWFMIIWHRLGLF